MIGRALVSQHLCFAGGGCAGYDIYDTCGRSLLGQDYCAECLLRSANAGLDAIPSEAHDVEAAARLIVRALQIAGPAILSDMAEMVLRHAGAPARVEIEVATLQRREAPGRPVAEIVSTSAKVEVQR